MSLFDALGRAFHKVVHGVESAGKAVVHGVEAVGHEISKVGKEVIKGVKKVERVVVSDVDHVIHVVVDGVMHAVGDLIGVHMRNPTPAEWQVIQQTHRNMVPARDKIIITSVAGLQGRPFTIPGSMVMAGEAGVGALVPVLGQIALIVSLLEHLWDKYLLNLGKGGYQNALSFWRTDFTNDITGGAGRPGSTLVHETTHVWQGYHKAFSWWYIFDSIYKQACCGNKAYDYTPGQNWADYHCEQQAHIVEDWWCCGGTTTSNLYPYMVSNIWTGSATTNTIFKYDPTIRHPWF